MAKDERTGSAGDAVGTPATAAPGEPLTARLERLTFAIEKMNLAEYTALLQNPWRLLWVNFIAGSARGLGLGFGFAVLTGALLYILRGLMLANLPVIGDLIATIVRLVEQNLRP
ncbi:MAG: DUF5665 domain-containing protein [Bacillota bacterium]